jgi:antitoxin PrlF
MNKGKSASDSSKKSIAQAGGIPAASYKGKITTAGTSEGFRFDKTLFRQHPEFKQKAEVRADVIGPGTILVSLINNPEMENEDDPVVSAFLAFLERDMLENPKTITRLSADQIARAKALTANVNVTDDELE